MAKPKKLVPVDYDFTVFSKEADVDYLLARFISGLGTGFFSRAAYFAHAACEKYMKAYTVQEGKRYLERHALLEIAETCLPFNPYFGEQETRRILNLFDSFEQVGRYGAGANYDPLATKGPGIETKGVMVWYVSHIQYLDAFVYKVRSFLNFAKKPGMDLLGRILAGDANNPLEIGWRGPPLIKVLTGSNLHFNAAKG